MITLYAENVNDAYLFGMQLLKESGLPAGSRAGDVYSIQVPVTTCYRNPQERVLFHRFRDANPFFHLMESLWMLAGRNDVEWLAQYNKRMKEFSDDGETFHGAYGHRLRNWLVPTGVIIGDVGVEVEEVEYATLDQLEVVIDMLKKDPSNRRVVCSIWCPEDDLATDSKDIPCNDMIKFSIRHGRLDMIVFNRSNDAIWGCYGANAVHFSFFQEYVAQMIGVEIGKYWQISTDFHAYQEIFDRKFEDLLLGHENRYEKDKLRPRNLIDIPQYFDEDLRAFMEGDEERTYFNDFFPQVAIPMQNAWFFHKAGNYDAACMEVMKMPIDNDWKAAATTWLNKRKK